MLKPGRMKRLMHLLKLLDSPNEGEAAAAYAMLKEFLTKHRMTMRDVTALMENQPEEPPAVQSEEDDPNAPPVFRALVELLRKYTSMKDHEFVAVALWVMHSYRIMDFTHSPKLLLLSPIRGCGKSTVLRMLCRLSHNGLMAGSVTAASIFATINAIQPTLLLDEGDNLKFGQDKDLKSVVNTSHERGHMVMRGRPPEHFSTYCAMAIAAIGTLPLPLMQRAVVIHMERARVQLPRFNPDGEGGEEVEAMARRLRIWAANAKLNSDPELPDFARNRFRDNWRPLISIADTLGVGKEARDVALIFVQTTVEEDPAVILLRDIREAFKGYFDDRMTSAELIERLHLIETSPWLEWRGMHYDQHARPLTQQGLADLLRPFKIKPRTAWPKGKPRNQTKSAKNYFLADFEDAWKRYCEEAPAERKGEQGKGKLSLVS
ncbi:MAG: DUF3631 domain-containing protein [Pseudolabrys sp.]|nr:DUF3631 domain-containing protein [Pseudolabrys sp.]